MVIARGAAGAPETGGGALENDVALLRPNTAKSEQKTLKRAAQHLLGLHTF
jgi:hypothetical protein